MKKESESLLQIVLGKQIVKKLATVNILIVGAGGIGCELAKNLSKSGFKKFTILDFDSIEVTNLNRQFYFHKSSIGKPKSQTVRQALLSIDSTLSITAINKSITDPSINALFYSQFDLVFSCLDSTKIREQLASQTTKNNKPLIDAGTSSYFGQSYSSIRFLNSCHNCNPSHFEDPINTCTIRSRPERPVHCATYAKNFYDSFFGGNLAESLSQNLKFEKIVTKQYHQYQEQQIKDIAIKLFVELFDQGIRDVDLEGNKIDLARKLRYLQALQMTEIVKNPELSTFDVADNRNQTISKYTQQKLWSIAAYSQQFIQRITSLLIRRFKRDIPDTFQKDDEDCMTLVLCITNLRTYNFINYQSKHNKHKYLTYYQCKDLIGKVFPAIASTNAIAAALEVREAIYVISKQWDKLRYISFGNVGNERLSPAIQSSPNIQCDYCSDKVIYAKLILDMDKVTFQQLESYAEKNYFTFNRDVTCGSMIIIRNSGKNPHPNKCKFLSFVDELIKYDVLELTFRPKPYQPCNIVHISVIHKSGHPSIEPIDSPSKQQLKRQMQNYYKKLRKEEVNSLCYELQMFGGHQM